MVQNELKIAVKKATLGDIKPLSKKLIGLLKDRRSDVYRENVTKFGIHSNERSEERDTNGVPS